MSTVMNEHTRIFERFHVVPVMIEGKEVLTLIADVNEQNINVPQHLVESLVAVLTDEHCRIEQKDIDNAPALLVFDKMPATLVPVDHAELFLTTDAGFVRCPIIRQTTDE